MSKKVFAFFSILFIITFSFSLCFASENMIKDAGNQIKDTVEDAGKKVENGVKNTENMVTDGTNKIENKDKEMMSETYNKMTRNNNDENSNYTAARTSTTDSTFMGMNATAWTWLIIGIAAIAIVALVWYYGTQLVNTNSDSMDE